MEEKFTLTITRKELHDAIGAGIKVHVNGKIDKLNEQVCTLGERFDEHCRRVEPVINQFEDRKGFWNTLSVSGKNMAVLSGLLTGGVILVAAIMKLAR